MADSVPIPHDPEARRRLAEFAGLTDEERHAIDQFCFDEEQKRQRGVLLYDAEPRLFAGHDPACRVWHYPEACDCEAQSVAARSLDGGTR